MKDIIPLRQKNCRIKSKFQTLEVSDGKFIEGFKERIRTKNKTI